MDSLFHFPSPSDVYNDVINQDYSFEGLGGAAITQLSVVALMLIVAVILTVMVLKRAAKARRQFITALVLREYWEASIIKGTILYHTFMIPPYRGIVPTSFYPALESGEYARADKILMNLLGLRDLRKSERAALEDARTYLSYAQVQSVSTDTASNLLQQRKQLLPEYEVFWDAVTRLRSLSDKDLRRYIVGPIRGIVVRLILLVPLILLCTMLIAALVISGHA